MSARSRPSDPYARLAALERAQARICRVTDAYLHGDATRERLDQSIRHTTRVLAGVARRDRGRVWHA